MKHRLPRFGAAALVLLAGCGARGEPEAGAVPEVEQAPPLADTLVLALPGGNTVWLAEGRKARDPSGTACVERSVEIRRDTVRLKVPLLFTATVPTRLDDSTIRAELSRDCRVSQVYTVGVRDGLPHRIEP